MQVNRREFMNYRGELKRSIPGENEVLFIESILIIFNLDNPTLVLQMIVCQILSRNYKVCEGS